MEFSRRSFLKGALVGGAGFSLLGFDLKPAVAQLKELKIARASETRSTCPYCAVGCGVLIYTIGDGAKNVTPQVFQEAMCRALMNAGQIANSLQP